MLLLNAQLDTAFDRASRSVIATSVLVQLLLRICGSVASYNSLLVLAKSIQIVTCTDHHVVDSLR
jgi:hypothetical protein